VFALVLVAVFTLVIVLAHLSVPVFGATRVDTFCAHTDSVVGISVYTVELAVVAVLFDYEYLQLPDVR
jgi:hypothetical protein